MDMIFNRLRPVGASVCLKQSQQGYAPYFPYSNIELIDSGTSALALALIDSSQHIDKASNVLMPAYACPDLLAAAHYAGLKAKLIDNLPSSYKFNLTELEQAIDSETAAIVAVNFLGSPQDMASLRVLADKYGIKLIEDRAQFFPIGKEKILPADYYTYSFGRGKPINTLGGGAIASKVALTPKTLKHIKQQHQTNNSLAFMLKASVYNLIITPFFYGILDRLPFLNIGQTAYHALDSITEISLQQKSILTKNIEQYKNRDRSNAQYLADKLISMRGITALYDIDKSLPLLRIAILAQSKQDKVKLLHALNEKGLGASPFYPSALNARADCQYFIAPFGEQTNATNLAERVITLPSHSGLTIKDAEHAIKTIQNRNLKELKS